MMRNESVSVCMATYNGALYVNEQIESILNQLIAGDEIIIVDDSSTDSTREKILSFNESRIKLLVNDQNIGVNRSFEKAIKIAQHEYIFLADQDDIWCENRIDVMLEKLKAKNVTVVSGNSIFIDQNGSQIQYPIERLKELESNKVVSNLIKIFKGTAPYYGCAMAFRNDLRCIILPFPDYIESHDLWIVKASLLQNMSYHIEENILFRRIHHNNASIIKRPIWNKLWSRIIFLLSMINLKYRILKIRKNKM